MWCLLEKNARSRHPRSLMLYSCRKNYRRRQWRPQSNPPSRCQTRTRDRDVTAGAQSHGTTAACAPTSTPTRSSWQRWRATRTAAAPIHSVTHLWADFVAHANACDKDAFSRAFRQLRGPKTFADRTPRIQFVAAAFASLGQPTAAPGAACLFPCISYASRREALSSRAA